MGTLKHRLKGGSVFRRELSETQEPYRIIFLSVEGKIEARGMLRPSMRRHVLPKNDQMLATPAEPMWIVAVLFRTGRVSHDRIK
jgi:hypothetical protein